MCNNQSNNHSYQACPCLYPALGAEEVEGRRCCCEGRKAFRVEVEGGTRGAGVAERSSDPPGYSDAFSPPWQLVLSGDNKRTHIYFRSAIPLDCNTRLTISSLHNKKEKKKKKKKLNMKLAFTLKDYFNHTELHLQSDYTFNLID